MELKVSLEVSENTRSMSLNIENDLGITDEDWATMTITEKMKAIKNYIYDLPEQPYWCLDKFLER